MLAGPPRTARRNSQPLDTTPPIPIHCTQASPSSPRPNAHTVDSRPSSAPLPAALPVHCCCCPPVSVSAAARVPIRIPEPPSPHRFLDLGRLPLHHLDRDACCRLCARAVPSPEQTRRLVQQSIPTEHCADPVPVHAPRLPLLWRPSPRQPPSAVPDPTLLPSLRPVLG